MLIDDFLNLFPRCWCQIIWKIFLNFYFLNQYPKLTFHLTFFSVNVNGFCVLIWVEKQSPTEYVKYRRHSIRIYHSLNCIQNKTDCYRPRHPLLRNIRPSGICHRHPLLRNIRPPGIRSLANIRPLDFRASAKEQMRQRNNKRQPQRRPEPINLETVYKFSSYQKHRCINDQEEQSHRKQRRRNGKGYQQRLQKTIQ